jgi:hypothetical protein
LARLAGSTVGKGLLLAVGYHGGLSMCVLNSLSGVVMAVVGYCIIFMCACEGGAAVIGCGGGGAVACKCLWVGGVGRHFLQGTT